MERLDNTDTESQDDLPSRVATATHWLSWRPEQGVGHNRYLFPPSRPPSQLEDDELMSHRMQTKKGFE